MTHQPKPPASSDAQPQLLLVTGHSAGAMALSFSPHNNILASADGHGIILWDVETGVIQRKLFGDSGHILGWLPDGTTLLSVGCAGAQVWDARDGTLLRSSEKRSNKWLLSPEGHVLTRDRETNWDLFFWDAMQDRIVRQLTGTRGCGNEAFALSADGSLLAISDGKGVNIIDALSGEIKSTLIVTEEELKKDHLSAADVRELALSPDGAITAAADSGAIRLWDTCSGDYISTLKNDNHYAYSIAFSPDGETLATGWSNGEILLHRQDSIQSIAAHRFGVISLSFSQDGTMLASGGSDNCVRIWDPRSGNLKTLAGGPDHTVYAVTFSTDGSTLVNAHGDNTFRLWDPKTCTLKETVHAGKLLTSVAAPAGALFGAGECEKGKVTVWDARAGRSIGSFEGCGPIALSADGRFIAFGEDYWYGHTYPRQFAVWDLQNGTYVRSIAASSDSLCPHTGWWPKRILSLALSQDGTLSAAGYSGELAVWHNNTGELLWYTRPKAIDTRALAFSPDGTTLAVVSYFCEDETVQFFSVENGEEIGRLPIKPGFTRVEAVNAVAFSPDGSMVVTSHDDGRITLWSYPAGERLVTLTILQDGSEGGTSSEWIAYTPNGHYTGSKGAERYIRWRVGVDIFPAEAYAADFRVPFKQPPEA